MSTYIVHSMVKHLRREAAQIRKYQKAWVAETSTEMALAIALTPFARHNLDVPSINRPEAYDASPGGHGRVSTHFPEQTISDMARWCDQGSPTTSLQGEFGIATDDADACPLRRICLPHSTWWHQIPRPGGYRHTALEEFTCGAGLSNARSCGQARLGDDCSVLATTPPPSAPRSKVDLEVGL